MASPHTSTDHIAQTRTSQDPSVVQLPDNTETSKRDLHDQVEEPERKPHTLMAPLRLNPSSERWQQQSSSTRVENNYRPPFTFGQDASTSEEAQQQSSQSSNAFLRNTTHHEQYITHAAYQTQRAQVAEYESMDSQNLLPANGTSSPKHNGKRLRDMSASQSSTDTDNIAPVPRLQYHHQSHHSEDSGTRMARGQYRMNDGPSNSRTAVEAGLSINRNLTPTSQLPLRSAIQRPASTYSSSSDFIQRGPSPKWSPRAVSSNSGKRTPENRPHSYIDLTAVPYAQQSAPAPINLDNSSLRAAVGNNASLLSSAKTFEMYRANIKKTNDPEVQYSFAIFLINAAQEIGLDANQNMKASPKVAKDHDGQYAETISGPASAQDLIREARQILSRLSDRSYPFAQYYLADGYASGLFNNRKEDNDKAFPLFMAASKHGHAESGYRTALCYEFGWGCRKDPAKAVQFYRQAASKNHPGAMTRLGRACLQKDLGLDRYREGLTWLKRATDAADIQYNAAPFFLGKLYESGYGDDIFQDETYAAQLFTQAADLGHAEASYRLGDAYEHGKLSCPLDPALSVHFYTGAAQQGHPAAEMALCAWYMIGAEPVLEKDEAEAYEWAHRAAEHGLTKAQYAVGYFTEMGIGCRRDPLEANKWYVKAAESGDERAKHRLAAIRAAASGGNPMEVASSKTAKKTKLATTKTPVVEAAPGKDDKECIVM